MLHYLVDLIPNYNMTTIEVMPTVRMTPIAVAIISRRYLFIVTCTAVALQFFTNALQLHGLFTITL
jgi:hypothetical protein